MIQDVEDQVVDALKDKTVLGAYHAVGADGAVQACARIVDRAKGKAIVVTVKGIPDDDDGIPVHIASSSFLVKQQYHLMGNRFVISHTYDPTRKPSIFGG